MGDVANEIPSHLFKLEQAGHVLGHNQTVVVAKQADLDLQVNMWFCGGVQLQRLPKIAGVEVGLERGVADQVVNKLPAVRTATKAQKMLR